MLEVWGVHKKRHKLMGTTSTANVAKKHVFFGIFWHHHKNGANQIETLKMDLMYTLGWLKLGWFRVAYQGCFF